MDISPRSTWSGEVGGAERGEKLGAAPTWPRQARGGKRKRFSCPRVHAGEVLQYRLRSQEINTVSTGREGGMSGWLSHYSPPLFLQSPGSGGSVCCLRPLWGSRSRRHAASRAVSGPRDCGKWGQGIGKWSACVFRRAGRTPGDSLSGFHSVQLAWNGRCSPHFTAEQTEAYR